MQKMSSSIQYESVGLSIYLQQVLAGHLACLEEIAL